MQSFVEEFIIFCGFGLQMSAIVVFVMLITCFVPYLINKSKKGAYFDKIKEIATYRNGRINQFTLWPNTTAYFAHLGYLISADYQYSVNRGVIVGDPHCFELSLKHKYGINIPIIFDLHTVKLTNVLYGNELQIDLSSDIIVYVLVYGNKMKANIEHLFSITEVREIFILLIKSGWKNVIVTKNKISIRTDMVSSTLETVFIDNAIKNVLNLNQILLDISNDSRWR